MRLRARLLLALAYVLLLAVVSLGLPLALSLRSRVDAEVRSQAESQADLVAATAADLLAPAQREGLNRLVATAAIDVRGRVIVVDAAGHVISDSARSDAGGNYGNRPEIASALAGRRAQIQRHSDSLGADLLATAVPIMRSGGTAGAVRITQGVAEVDRAVRRITIELALLAALVLALGLAAGVLIARSVARPIVRLEDAARRVAGGDLLARAPVDEGSAEQRSLARSLNDMTARLSRTLERQREFVADASHQLRTPLTGVRLRVEEARALGVSPAAAHELEAAEAEVDRMAQLVDELLVLSRAGDHELPCDRLRLPAVVEAAAERWAPLAAMAGVGLTVESTGAMSSPPVPAAPTARDETSAAPSATAVVGTVPAPGGSRARTETTEPPGRRGARPKTTRPPDRRTAHIETAWAPAVDLDRAVDSIVENAIRYAAPGSAIEIVALPGAIEVRDRGPGIDADEIDLVWERFHRGRAGRRHASGTGLGLPIARELARGWGGDASLRPRPGGGTIARLDIPAAADGPMDRARPSTHEDPA